MKKQITEKIEIPSEVSCEITDGILKCKKGDVEITRDVRIPNIIVSIKDKTLLLECKKGNKKDFKVIKSYLAHINNMFAGLQQEYVYKMEACNVHFPMTIKIEANKVVISNFLGEKTKRYAKIINGVKVDIKGQKITVSSADKEAAGQTAANLEKTTKIRNRDRRIFQDGIFLTEGPGRGKK